MSSLIEFNNVSFRYDKGSDIISNLSFNVELGSFLGVLGPNGGGKSTLLKLMIGLLQPHKGEILYYGKSVQKFKEFPLQRISYVAQADILDTPLPLSIADVIKMGRLTKAEEFLTIDEALSIVGLKKSKSTLIRNLSGGERQRALLAKALMKRPELMIMDEPTKGLDSKGQSQLLQLVDDVKKQHKTTIIIVDHNINHIIEHCDGLLCLNRDCHWFGHKSEATHKIIEEVYKCELDYLNID